MPGSPLNQRAELKRVGRLELRRRAACLPAQGGNDYEIFVDPRVVGHTVAGPEDTIAQLRQLFPSPS